MVQTTITNKQLSLFMLGDLFQPLLRDQVGSVKMVEEQLLASVKMNVFFPVTPIPMPVTLEALRTAKSRKVAYQVMGILTLIRVTAAQLISPHFI